MSIKFPVKRLNAETARKIAAGEVIDRPNAIVRELMDNAIDSGATNITVEVCGGGIDKIRIVDNGCGLTKEDLEICAHPHCTSKIETDTDLLNLSTLGFRGEALASIAAVSRLSIISGGWKMRASITEDHIMEPFTETNGTIVQAEGLFENFPARRQFLKRPASEGLLCKTTFIEKTLPRPDIAFRLILDGETKIDLQKNQTIIQRFVRSMGFKENEKLFYEIKANDPSGRWSFKAVLGEPSVNRTNKKDISIFVNGRKIQEYSLVQAVEYGGQGFFPNGTYPVAAVFLEIDPHDVDFNIHPAKREARFSDISSIHHGISSTVRNFYKNYTIQGLASKALNINTYSFIGEQQVKKTDQKELFDNLFTNTKKSNDSEENKTDNFFRTSYKIPSHQVSSSLGISDIKTDLQKEKSVSLPKSENQSSQRISRFDLFKNKINVPSFGNKDSSITNIQSNNFDSERKNSALQKLSEEALDLNKSVSDENSDYKFLGCTLGTFLVAEKNGSLFIIDQHAAHERMIFNKIMNEKPNKISLIIPYILETESEGDNNYLESIKLNLSECGFDIQKSGKNTWEITTTPDRWKGTEKDLRDAILSKRLEPNEIIRSIAAMTACRSSVMDGYVLDEITASEIAREALKLEDPHCPHGRPIYTELSREKLFMLVKRT